MLRPPARWPQLDLPEFWEFRDLLLRLTLREVKLRYRQTFLGVGWVILQPLMAAAVLGFVFGRIAQLPTGGRGHFALAFVGVLSWTAFSGALMRSAPAVVQNVSLVSKVFFPRTLLPLSAAAASMLDVLVGLVLALAIAVASGIEIGLPTLSAPLWVFTTSFLGLGMGLIAAALMVKFRDVQHMLPVLVQLALFACPLAFPVSAIPPGYRNFFHFNPLAGLMEGLRWSVLGIPPASWPATGAAVLAALLLGLVGLLFFRALERDFADAI